MLIHSQSAGTDYQDYFFSRLAPAASLSVLLYSAASEAEQTISRISNQSGCNRRVNLLRATQGFAYIFGSMIVSVSSMMSWFTRWNVSSTFISSLWGRPTLSIQVLVSKPTVSTTNVVSSVHLPTEYPYHRCSSISLGSSRPSLQMVRHASSL